MIRQVYERILVELGEILQPTHVQKKLRIEYTAPIEMTVKNYYFAGYYIFRLRRTRDNFRQPDSDEYVRPYYIQEELQHNLERRRLSGLSFIGSLRLYIRVEEDRSRFYKIFVKVAEGVHGQGKTNRQNCTALST